MAVNLFVMECELLWEEPEIYLVRVPYAHLGLGHTNCYLFRDGADTLVVDPGVRSLSARQILLRSAGKVGIDLSHARFLCTHLHFDHAGMLKDLTRPGSQILMSEIAYRNNPWNHYTQRKKRLRDMLQKEGVPPHAIRGLAASMSEARVCDLPERSYKLLDDGDVVRVGAHTMRVIATPGHNRGHICLFSDDQGFLISGDHVLENTTPGLSLPFEGDNSTRDYLDSLTKVEKLPCRAVLPGHGESFYNLAERVALLREHHAERLGQVYEVVANNPGASGYAILRAMPWTKRGPFKKWDRLNPYLRLNMRAQMFSYLEYLVHDGEIVRTEDEAGWHYCIA